MENIKNEAAEGVLDGSLTTGNFTMQAALPMGKSITMSGYIYAHNDAKSISKQIDVMVDVIDRQRARAEIPELEVKLEQKYAALRNHKDHLDSILGATESLKNKEKLSSTNKKSLTDNQAMINNMLATITKIEEEIDKGAAAIKEAKEKAK